MADRGQSDHIWDTSAQIDSTGSANAYVITTAVPITGYARGMPPVRFKANFSNTDSATANINGLGAVTLKKNGGAANLASGDIVSGGVYTLIYDGTNLQVLELNAAAIVGVTDGDKGDITVSSNGTVWTIDSGVIAMTVGRRTISNVSSGDTIQTSDRAKLIIVFAGTGTITFPAAATLTGDWFCYIHNDGTGDVTLAAAGGEQIDDLSSWVLYPGGCVLVQCGGSNLRCVLLAPMRKVFTASDTFTTPGAGKWADVEVIGDGAGGGRGGAADGGAGGGGGSCVLRRLPLSDLAATVAVTIGTGGAGATADNTAGSAGTGASFGSHVVAYTGGAGDGINASPGGGGGGGTTSAGASVSSSITGGNGGSPLGGAGGGGGNQDGGDSNFGGGGGGSGMSGTGNLRGGDSVYGGGGGSGGSSAALNAGRGGNSVYGGGGGGGGSDAGTPGAGGTSLFAGNGGAGATGSANATNGSAPGGGGGGSETGNGGSGARGEVRVVIS